MKYMLFIIGFGFSSGISILFLVANDPEPKGAIISLVLWMILGLIVASFSYLALLTLYKPSEKRKKGSGKFDNR